MFTFLFNTLTRSIVVVLIAIISVNYIPDSIFKDFPLEPKLVEPLNFDSVIPSEWNTRLSDGKPEFIQLNNILGPESIAISESGLIYTGLADGRLVELDPSKNYKLRTVLKPSHPECNENVATKATECGRFLQMRFQNGTLFAVEANSGLYKIDVKSGNKQHLGPKPIAKKALYNSFAFDPKDTNIVYITISSNKWDLSSIMWSFIEHDNSGQVIALDLSTNKRVILFDGLILPNGIDVDVKRDQMIFTETLRSRVNSALLSEIRSSIKSTQDKSKVKGVESRVLIPLLPGNPDNIVIEGDIAYIALPFVKLNGKELIDHLSAMPHVRRAIGRFTYGLGMLIEYFHKNLYSHPVLETIFGELKSGHINYRIVKSDKSAIIEYNLATGASRMLGSSTFGFVSEAVPDREGNLYLGSFRSPFIVKQKL